MIQIIDIIL